MEDRILITHIEQMVSDFISVNLSNLRYLRAIKY